MTTADLVLTGGKILTLDRQSRIVQSLAVRGGRIAALGRESEIAGLIGPDTRRLDLRGRLAVPGLIDGHAHMDREGLKLRWPSLAAARSIGDILEIVEAEVRRTPHGEWIVTMPIGEPPMYEGVPGNLAENRWPTRHDLDRVAPDHPVYIRAIWGHWRNTLPLVSIANTRALERAGIGRDTRPPAPSIEIERDASGRPDRRPRRADVQAAGRAHAHGGGAALHPAGSGGGPRRVHAHLQSLRHHQRLRGPRHLERGPRGVPGRARAGPAERAGASLVEPGLAVRRSRARARPRAELGRLAEPPRARRRVPARGRASTRNRTTRRKTACARPPSPHTGWAGFSYQAALPEDVMVEMMIEAARNRHPRRQLHAEYPRPLRAREPRRAHRGPAMGHRAHRRLRPG